MNADTVDGVEMKKRVIDILVILAGNFLLAVSVNYFVLPFNILSGGVAGIAVITKSLFSWDPTIVIDVLVIGMFFIGWLFLGREFAVKTALSSIVYPVFLELLKFFPCELKIDMIMACLYGGVLAGIGIGLVFRHNGSTGGTDIPPLIIHKYTGMEVGKLILILDAICALAGMVAYGIEDLLFGLLYIYISSNTINRTMVPKTDEAVALYIISNEVEKICNYIHIDLYRGTTLLDAKGGYTGEDKSVILTVVSKDQYLKLSKFVDETDPYAFIIVSDAKDIKGEGFTYEPRV